MADVAGLVFGAVTVFSLYSTCVELFDVFELGKNYIYDYHLACTKISLLRARLSHWGDLLNIKIPGSEHPVLRNNWPAERDIVGRSLFGIKNILGDTALLAEKYKLALNCAWKLKAPSAPQASQSSVKPASTRSLSISTWSLLRKRTSWAIRDKDKFDNLIQDLSFFVENLEKVTERYQMPPESSNTALRADHTEEEWPLVPRSASTVAAGPPIRVQKQRPPAQQSPPIDMDGQSDHIPDQQGSEQQGHVSVSGVQNNDKSGGVQGALGQTNHSLNISGTQTNTNEALGVQGVTSNEAAKLFDPNRSSK
ncbi:hypothetical protein MMC10_009337 [Thelotrema lepadinum]|nr:hypothetical protein [Thelotrema lepadinum]